MFFDFVLRVEVVLLSKRIIYILVGFLEKIYSIDNDLFFGFEIIV